MKNLQYRITLLGLAIAFAIPQSCTKEKLSVNNKYPIVVSPNPCDSIAHVYFELNKEENGKAILYGDNKNTSIVFHGPLSSGSHDIKIDLTGKKSAMYFLEIQIGNTVDKIQILKN